MTTTIDPSPRISGSPRRTSARLAGYGFAAAWVVGLAVNPSGPAVDAPDAEVAAHYATNAGQALSAELFTHGVAAVCLALVAAAVVRYAKRAEKPYALYLTAVYGAAALSAIQIVAGTSAVVASEPSTVAGAFDVLNRLDGTKLLLFAVAAAASTRIFDRWISWTSVALAGTMVIAGVGFLLASPALALAAGPALVLLIVWVAASGGHTSSAA